MRFQVPQYIQIEDKLLGVITVKQLSFLGSAFLITYLTFRIFGLFWTVIVGTIVWSTALSFSFLKVNGKPFYAVLPGIVRFLFSPKRFTWKKKPPLRMKVFTLPTFEQFEEIPQEPLASPAQEPPRLHRPDGMRIAVTPRRKRHEEPQAATPQKGAPQNPYYNLPLPRFFKHR